MLTSCVDPHSGYFPIRALAATELEAGRITAAGIEAASLDNAVDTLAEQLSATWAGAEPRLLPTNWLKQMMDRPIAGAL